MATLGSLQVDEQLTDVYRNASWFHAPQQIMPPQSSGPSQGTVIWSAPKQAFGSLQ